MTEAPDDVQKALAVLLGERALVGYQPRQPHTPTYDAFEAQLKFGPNLALNCHKLPPVPREAIAIIREELTAPLVPATKRDALLTAGRIASCYPQPFPGNDPKPYFAMLLGILIEFPSFILDRTVHTIARSPSGFRPSSGQVYAIALRHRREWEERLYALDAWQERYDALDESVRLQREFEEEFQHKVARWETALEALRDGRDFIDDDLGEALRRFNFCFKPAWLYLELAVAEGCSWAKVAIEAMCFINRADLLRTRKRAAISPVELRAAAGLFFLDPHAGRQALVDAELRERPQPIECARAILDEVAQLIILHVTELRSKEEEIDVAVAA